MTQEHVTITEEVQTKDGLVTQERVTLQTTAAPEDDPAGNAAMGVLHPDYVSAADRTYTYNEATGMSESAPAGVEPDEEAKASDDEPLTEEEMGEAEEGEAQSVDDDDDEPEASVVAEECGKPVGSGFCVLEPNHAGAHRLSLPEA